jgi:uncharacterized protein YbjQ (UPF0145 family)
MIVATTETVPGHTITRIVNIVHGNAVICQTVGQGFTAGLRQFTGGEVPEYANLMAQSRYTALCRMIDEAARMGAQAIVGVRYATSEISGGMAEMMAYGTAVMLEPEQQREAVRPGTQSREWNG